MATHRHTALTREIERIRNRRKVLAAEDDALPSTTVGFRRLKQQLAAQATSAKARNESILQKLAAAGECDAAGAAAAEVQLIALRGAYLTLVERSFPDWQQQALQHLQQQPDMQQRSGSISRFAGGSLQAAAALSSTTRSNGWQAPMPASPQASTGAESDPQQPLQQQQQEQQQQERQQQKLVDSQAAIKGREPQSYIRADPNSYKHAVKQTAESVSSTGVSLGRSSSSAAAAALQKLAEAAAVLRANYDKAGELVESGASESAATDTAMEPVITPSAAHAADDLIQHHLAPQHAMQQPPLQQEQQEYSQQHPKQPPRQQAVSDGGPGQASSQQATQAQIDDGNQLAAVLPEQVAAAAAAVANYSNNHNDGAVSAAVTEQQHWGVPAAAAVPAQRGKYKLQGTHVGGEQLQQQGAPGHRQQHVFEEQQDNQGTQLLTEEASVEVVPAGVLQQAHPAAASSVPHVVLHNAVADAGDAVTHVPAAHDSTAAVIEEQQGQLQHMKAHALPAQQQQQQQQQMDGNSDNGVQKTNDQQCKRQSELQEGTQGTGTRLPEADNTVQLQQRLPGDSSLQCKGQSWTGGVQAAHAAPAVAEETDEVQHMEGGGSSAALPFTSLPPEAETEQLQQLQQLQQQQQQQMEEQPRQHRTAQQVYMQLEQHDSQPFNTAPWQEGRVNHLTGAAAAQAENSAGVEAEAALSAAAPCSRSPEEIPGAMLSALGPAVLTDQVCCDADIREADGTTVVSVSVTGARVSAKDEKTAATGSDEETGSNSSHKTGSFEVPASVTQVGPAAVAAAAAAAAKEEEERKEEQEMEGRGGRREEMNGQGSKGTADDVSDADVNPGQDAQGADPGLEADAAVIAVATLASSISAEKATEHEGTQTESSTTVASSLRPRPASAAGSTGSLNPPTGQPSRATPQTNLGLSSLAVELGPSSIDAGVVSNIGSSATAVVIGMGSAGTGSMGAAAGVQVAGTTGGRGPLGYDAGMLLSPATRLSLGAASVGDASIDGRPSLSTESDVGSSRRQSLKAAAAGGGRLGSVNLQPLLKVPSVAVPGSDTLASSPAASSSCRTTAVVYDGIEPAAVYHTQGVQQQEHKTTAHSATSSTNALPRWSTSVGSPERQRQQQAGRTDALEPAAAMPRHHRLQPDQTPPVQCRQLLHEVKLMDKILNTGLTDFAGSDSEEEDKGDCRTLQPASGIAGNAKAAVPARPPTLPPDTADGGIRVGGASNPNLLQEPGSMQRAAADSSSMQDDDFDF